MDDKEFEERFKNYLEDYTGTLEIPECEFCDELAEVEDNLSGYKICIPCLKKDLKDDLENFIDTTN